MQAHQACQVLGAAPAHRASRVKMVDQDLVVRMENVVLLAPRVFLVWLVQLVSLEEMETLDQMVCQAEMELQVPRVTVVKMALLVPLELLVTQALLVLSVQLERAVTEEKLALLVLLGPPVLPDQEVLLVPKAHAVTKGKPVSVVLWASKDIADSLATQGPPDLRVPLVIKVQLAVQALQAPEDLLDLAGPLARTEQVDTLVPLDHRGPEVTEVKEDLRAPQATQDNQALLDLLVPLVHVVVLAGLLPLLVLEPKKLVVLPHIMEMNR